MKLADIAVGMTVFSASGNSYKVLAVDGQKFPVFVQSLTNGTTGRFAPSSLSSKKAVKKV